VGIVPSTSMEVLSLARARALSPETCTTPTPPGDLPYYALVVLINVCLCCKDRNRLTCAPAHVRECRGDNKK
jgi:hypothetical protein